MISPARPSKEDVLNIFRVEPESGRIFWTNPLGRSRTHGKEAGTLSTCRHGKPYHIIKIRGRFIRRGHIIFFYVNDCWPTHFLDHINGDSLDDRIENLRQATATQNSWNKKSYRKGSNLPMGVTRKEARFQARIGLNGKLIPLGCYSTPEEASAVYQLKRKELFGEFA